MSFYLLDHPNPNGNHFYTTRKKRIKGQIIHITAGLEDTDLRGPDSTAEGEARYAASTDREVSWHSGSDTDSFVKLLPYSYTAFQCIDYNSTTAGHEISKLETDWRDDDPDVVLARLIKAADCIRPDMLANGIPFRKASKVELDHAIATDGPPVGMIGHGELDPTRRTDPGLVKGVDTFPWGQFIDILKNGSPTPEEEDMTDAQFKAMMDALNGIKSGVSGLYNSGFASRNADGTSDPTHEAVSIFGVNNELNKISGLLENVLEVLTSETPTPTV